MTLHDAFLATRAFLETGPALGVILGASVAFLAVKMACQDNVNRWY